MKGFCKILFNRAFFLTI